MTVAQGHYVRVSCVYIDPYVFVDKSWFIAPFPEVNNAIELFLKPISFDLPAWSVG